ncbi:MAG: PilZ domain-containing protein, partial [Acidimicrobiia bacterium]
VKIRSDVEMSIDGKPATMVDLSILGMMVVLAPVLRPGQRVRVMIIDHDRVHRLAGTVIWSSFEMAPDRIPRYRAGVCFQGADPMWLEDFCTRNRIKVS